MGAMMRMVSSQKKMGRQRRRQLPALMRCLSSAQRASIL